MEITKLPPMFSDWKIVGELGQGSFGTVYKIERDLFGKAEKAALKCLSIPQHKGDIEDLYCSGYDDASVAAHFQGYLADIVREYSLMAEIKGHTNVVYCDDIRYIQHDDGFGWDIYIKMELLTPMMKRLDALGSDESVIKLGRDLCNALVLCQDKGIVHRDIKPQNIFVSDTGDYKLGDFGIARTMENATQATAGIGTVSYMAPEVRNNQQYDSTVDIYSLGLVMHWLLNERRGPFLPLPPKAPTKAEMEAAREARFSGKAIPAPKNGSEKLKAIVLKACAFDPKDRYQSAREMLEDLNALSGQGGSFERKEDAPAPVIDEDEKTHGYSWDDGGEESDKTIGPDFDTKPAPVKKKKKIWPLIMAIIGLIAIVVAVLLSLRSCNDNPGAIPSTASAVSTDAPHNTSITGTAYTISLDVNGGEAGTNSITVAEGSVIGTLPTPTREGYHFEGWHTAAEGGEPVNEDTIVTAGGFQTLYAHWSVMSYTITFDANGGQVMPSSAVITFDAAYGELPVPERTGFTFVGWYTAVADGSQVCESTVVSVAQDHTLYAVWSADAYTVEWNAVDGCTIIVYRKASPYAGAEEKTLSSGDEIYYGDLLSVTYIPHTGYTLSSMGSTSITVEGYVTSAEIYAVIASNSYEVSWSEGTGYTITVKRTASPYGGGSTGTLSNGATVYYGDELTVVYAAQTGYSLSSTGSTSITVSGNVTSSEIYATATVKRYKVSWNEGTGYTITVKRTSSPYGGGSTGTLSNGATIYYGDKLTVTYTSQTGYSLSSTGSTSITVSGNVTSSEIYATATAKRYKVSWNEGTGYTITVKRTSSPYGGGSTGTLSNGATIYYGDKLSVTYTVYAGYSLSSTGSTSITVSGNVTSSEIYATATVKRYKVSWNEGTGYTITVKRTSSPYGGGSTGTLSNGATIYYGDKLSVTYTVYAGYSLSSTGSTSITVSGNVTSSDIYATATVKRYKVSWNTGTGYTITVKRTSSPYGGGSTGTLSNGATIYYGDKLTVTYTSQTGYSLSSTGSTSITVSGNVTSSDIYATATAKSYTYNVVYQSTNGTILGSTTVSYRYGTTNKISPVGFSGYITPEAKTVTWDSTSAKTITFVYTPETVSNAKKTGTICTSPVMTYSAKLEYRNRTATSVEVRVVWTTTIEPTGWNRYGQRFNLTVGSSTTTTKISAYGTWDQPTVGKERSCTGTSDWITVSLNTTDATSVSMSIYYYQVNSNGADATKLGYAAGMNLTWTINIPAY